MKNSNNSYASLAILAASLLSACGGGGSSPEPTPPVSPNPPPTQGITRNGIAVGPISNFGSVVVNGVRYETNAATVFEIDENTSGLESDLDVGDTVAIIAELDEDSGISTALRVIYDDAVTGPVASVNLSNDTFVVLGQTIEVTQETSFDDDFTDPDIEGLIIGDIVEVSGTPDADGIILATRVEPEPAGTQFEVQGVVSTLDMAAQTFTINALTVDFSAAMLEDFPNGEISNDDFVEAEGMMLGGNGELIATEVSFEEPLPTAAEDDFVEIEGFITRFASAQDFDVAGLQVTTNAQTQFTDGTEQDLALNQLVEIEGIVDSAGVLVAEEVQIRVDSDVFVAAAVDSIDTATNTIVVLGIDVVLDELTRLEDQSSLEIDPLNLTDISVGDIIEVGGSENPSMAGQVEAAILERVDAGDDTELHGFVSAVSQPTLTVLGVTIETDSNTEFADEDENELTANEFFALVVNGDLIEVIGTESSATTITASEIEIQSAD